MVVLLGPAIIQSKVAFATVFLRPSMGIVMDEHENSLPNHLFISLRHEFKATRVIGNRLSPTTIKVKVDISTLDQDTDDYGLRMEVALAKFTYFFEKVLNNSILIHVDNEWALDSFMDGANPSTSNMVVLCPEEATDACLAELLICKMKAISQGAFEFLAIDIESSDARGMSFTFVGSFPGESFLSAEEWLTERNYFIKPWWHRPDASTLDVIPDEDDDLLDLPSWAYNLNFIADAMIAPEETENKVVRAEFRPRVIDGGKVD